MSDPEAWAQAVEIDWRIRNLWHGRVPSQMFLHRSLVPLDEVVFQSEADSPRDPFNSECEGMCGV